MPHNIRIVAALVSSLLLFAPGSARAEAEKWRVGVIAPLSGDVAAWGEAFQNGIKMCFEKLPEDLRQRITVDIQDDGLQPKNSVSALQKLLSSGPIDLLVNISSGTGNVLAPLAEEKKIPFISVSTDPKVSAGRHYTFSLWVTPEEELKLAVAEAKRRGYKNIARIGTIHDGVIAVKKVFDSLNQGAIGIELDEEYAADVKDFRPYITKLKAKEKNLQAIFVVLLPGQVGLFAKQLRQLHVGLPMFGFETVEDANELKVSDGALAGTWYVNADDGDGAFMKEYTNRFPKSSSFSAANSCDTIALLGDAMSKGVSKEGLPEYLGTLKDFHGALGTYSARGDQRFTLPATVKVVTKDGFEKFHP